MPDVADLFAGFESHWIDVTIGRVFARVAGDGPRSSYCMASRRPMSAGTEAPTPAKTHRVVVLDMRGYGWSSAPRSSDGALYAKRAMARDVIEAMGKRSHIRLALAGHDGGARVGYRLALDHPGRIERLTLIDILPTFHVWRQIRAGLQPWASLGVPGPARARARDGDCQGPCRLCRRLTGELVQRQVARAIRSARARTLPCERQRALTHPCLLRALSGWRHARLRGR